MRSSCAQTEDTEISPQKASFHKRILTQITDAYDLVQEKWTSVSEVIMSPHLFSHLSQLVHFLLPI